MSAVVKAASSTSAAEVADVNALLTPITGGNPSGESLRYAGLYDEVGDARRADEDIASGEWKKVDAKSAEWNRVVKLTTEALSTRTKDIQVCAWLTEALVKLYGFVGLRDGLRVMRGLHEQFWDTVYPEIDEEYGLDGRAKSLQWLSDNLARSIKEIPITRAFDGVNYSYFQWNDSREFDIPENLEGLDSNVLDRVDELRRRATTERKITSEEWRKAKNTTSRAFFEETYALLNESWEELRTLDRVMDEKFVGETPGLGALSKSLDDVRSLVEKLVKEKRTLEPDPIKVEEAASTTATSDAQPQNPLQQAVGRPVTNGTLTGPIKTRQDAFKRLAEVAEYFRQSEPHSPVSYLVERAIRWGQMPLEAWLQDVIKEGGALDNLRETLGLKTTSDGNSSNSSDDES